jgi:hypothetical protein
LDCIKESGAIRLALPPPTQIAELLSSATLVLVSSTVRDRREACCRSQNERLWNGAKDPAGWYDRFEPNSDVAATSPDVAEVPHADNPAGCHRGKVSYVVPRSGDIDLK